MKLHVPHLRDKLALIASWTFTVYSDNEALMGLMGYGYDGPKRDAWLKQLQDEEKYLYHIHPLPEKFTLPVGTVLSVDCYYIRNGQPHNDAITFRATIPQKKGAPLKVRFRAALDDCNQIEFVPA